MRCKPRLKMLLALLLAAWVVGGLAFGNWLYNDWCSTAEAHETLRTMCGMYARGEVAGNMCPALCEESKFTISHCAGNHDDKKVIIMHVHEAGFSNSQYVVFKTDIPISSWSSEFQLDQLNNTEQMINHSKQFILRQVWENFNIDISSYPNLLSYIWRQNFNSFILSTNGSKEVTMKQTATALDSILSLAKQNEYLTMLVLTNSSLLPDRNFNTNSRLSESVEKSRTPSYVPIRNFSAISGMPEIAEKFRMSAYMPTLHGSCGPAYIVDNTPSLILSAHVLFQGKAPDRLSYKYVTWSDRASVALQLLDMVKHLESSDDPQLIHCDLVPHNIGLDHQKRVVLLDVDSIFFKRIKRDDFVCTTDEPCGFKQCKRRCDGATRRCVEGLVSSHLQMLCRDTFITDVPLLGLLRGPPSHVADTLQRLLWQCSFHSNDMDSYKSDDLMRQNLFEVLKKSLED